MNRIKVILNPYANRWRAGSRADAVRAALVAAGLQPDIIETEGPREGIALAETAVTQGYDAVIAAGGQLSVVASFKRKTSPLLLLKATGPIVIN